MASTFSSPLFLELPISVKLRLGLIGLGPGWENRHRPALRAMADRFEVTAVFDQVTHRALSVATQFEAAHVEGYRLLAEREDVDAVMLLSDGWYGVLPVLAACTSGKAIYFAAPVDLTRAESEAIRGTVQESGVAFLAEMARRYMPATLRLKELIATTLGQPKLIFCHQHSPEAVQTNHRPAESDRDPCRREIVELVDWCRFVVGSEPSWVTSIAHQPIAAQPAADYQFLSLDFSTHEAPGAMAQISCSSYIPVCWSEALGYRPQAAMQVSCERGVAFVDLPSTLVWFDETGRHHEMLDSERPLGERLLTRFFRAVTSLVVNTADLEDTCRAVHIFEQAQRSQREGRRLEL